MLEKAVSRHGKAINEQKEEEGPTERVAAVLPCGQKTASDSREELGSQCLNASVWKSWTSMSTAHRAMEAA